MLQVRRGRPPKPMSAEELLRREQQECLREASKTRAILSNQIAKLVEKVEAPNVPFQVHLEMTQGLATVYEKLIKATESVGKGIRAVPEEEARETSLEDLVGAG